MAERWQQWMPFYVDRFRGSPDVQAMHPVARIGYLYLLASAWQTEDCSLPNDPLDLASISGLGDDLWAQYSVRILRKFDADETGTRLRNQVLYEEWSQAKTVYDRKHRKPEEVSAARSAAGRVGNEKRWGSRKSEDTNRKPDKDSSQTDRKPSLTGTVTGTETTTGTEVPSTLALTSAEVPAVGVFGLPLPGKQGEWQVPEALYREMVELYPGVGVMEQLAKMRAWLLTNNRKTARGLPRFINNWLGRAQDDLGKRGGNGNGRINGSGDKAERNRATVQRLLAERSRDEAATEPRGGADDGADDVGGRTGQGTSEGRRPEGSPGGAGGDESGGVHPGLEPERRAKQLFPHSSGFAQAQWPS